MGHRGDKQLLLLDDPTQVAGHQGGEREKPNDWLGPQNGSGDPFPSAEVNSKNVSF